MKYIAKVVICRLCKHGRISTAVFRRYQSCGGIQRATVSGEARGWIERNATPQVGFYTKAGR